MASSDTIKQGTKRKRVVLTLKQKMEICRRLERGENRNVLMKEFNIGSSTIYDIKSQSDNLKEFFGNSESEKCLEKRHTLHSPKLEYLDRALYEWFMLKRSEGVSLSGTMLVGKAREFYEQMNLAERCSFSNGWLSRFKARHGIRRLDLADEQKTVNSKQLQGDDQQKTVGKFCEDFSKLISENGLTAEHIYNADETGLLWRHLPNTILGDSDSGDTEGLKLNKDRLTVLVCANAAGTHKVALTVIGKYAKPRCLKGIPCLPVHYKSQTNGLMDSDIFIWWFHHVFVPSVKDNLRRKGLSDKDKVVLLIDSCRAHPEGHELMNGNIFVCFLPSWSSDLVEPMIHGVVNNLKTFYRRNFMRKLTNYEGKVQDFQSKYTVKEAIYNLSCSWNCVKPIALRRCWQKLWPKVVLEKGPGEGVDENGKRDKRPEDTFDEIIELVDCACDDSPVKRLSKSDLVEWLEIDKDIPVTLTLNADEIADDVVNCDYPEVVEALERCEEDVQEKEITWNNAAAAFDTIVTFIERQPNFTAEDVLQFHLMHSNFLHQKLKAYKQAHIRQLFNRTATLERSSPVCRSANASDQFPTSTALDVLNYPAQFLY